MFNEKTLNLYAIMSFTSNLILVVDESIVYGVLTFVRLNTTKKLASRHVTHYICVYICDHIHTFIYFRSVLQSSVKYCGLFQSVYHSW